MILYDGWGMEPSKMQKNRDSAHRRETRQMKVGASMDSLLKVKLKHPRKYDYILSYLFLAVKGLMFLDMSVR